MIRESQKYLRQTTKNVVVLALVVLPKVTQI